MAHSYCYCLCALLQNVLVTILVVGLFPEEGFSQCFTDKSCTGDTVPAATERECCVDTNEGLAFADGGACTACIVHGFANVSYAVVEDKRLDTTFSLNVKGETNLPLMISGAITSEAGTASSSDFKELQPIKFENNAEIHLFTTNDAITLEYNDTVILRFTPDNPLLIAGVESRGEYIRHSATVKIMDNDLLEINFEEADYPITEGKPLSVLIQFRRTQSPFNITLRPLSIASAEDIGLGNFTNCAAIWNDSRAIPGVDFTNMTFNFTVEGDSTELGVFRIELVNITYDDEIDEIEQSFTLVAEIGDDVPDSFACFQRHVGDTDCFGRTGATEIRIMDNDAMIIGFDQRRQSVSENASCVMDGCVAVSINVSTVRTSNRTHTIVFRYQASSSTARVGTLTQQDDPKYDALFGARQNPSDDFIVEIRIISPGDNTIPSLTTYIQNDILPEDRECYTISIITTDVEGVRELFTCNEDESNSTDFFCDHTICIDDDDEPFMIAFVETTYTVTESEGQVEVCINFTHPDGIMDFAIFVESYNSSVYIPSNAVVATPDSPDFLGEYSMAPGADYEEQKRGINHIRDTVINEARGIMCYNQTIYNDTHLEMSEYLGLTLAVRDSSIHTEIQPEYDQVAIRILDDDTAVVGLESTFYQVSEDVGVVEVCAIVYSPNVACPIEFLFTVRLTTTNDSAVSPMDYTHVSNILEFAPCDTRQCSQTPIVDNRTVELTESFFVTLERTSDLMINLGAVSGKVEITDNDEAVVGLERTSYTVAENAGIVEVCVIVYSPRLPCPISQAFEVRFSTNNDSTDAVTPMDYGAVSTIMTFTACETRRCVDIIIVNDTEGEPDETFGITLERTPGLTDRISLDPMDGMITISGGIGFSPQCYSQLNCETGSEIETPADTPTAKDCCVGTNEGQSYADSGGNCIVPQCLVHGFANASYDVKEGGFLNTTFKLNVKGTTSLALVILGTITSEAGTARSSDFEDLQPITLNNIANIRLFTINDDVTLEYDDTVILRFTPNNPAFIPSVEGAGEFIRDTAVVNIIDNDRLEINIEEPDYSILEDAASNPVIRLQFRRTQNPFTMTIFPVNISDLNCFNFTAQNFIDIPTISEAIATADVDFTSESFTITIPATAGRPPGLIFEDIQLDDSIPRFRIIDDNVNEITQSFALVTVLGDDVPDSFACFQRQVGDTDCFGRTGATRIIIVDNDVMIIGFTQRRQTVSESDAEFYTLSLYLPINSLRPSELDYEVLFRVLETGNATVEAYNLQFQIEFDALFGTTFDEQSPIMDYHVLMAGSLELSGIETWIVNDFVPEDPIECYEIRILSPDDVTRTIFTCNEGEADPVNFFCIHTICIKDDDEPFEVAYIQTVYTVNESVGQVEVCVNLTHPDFDILEETVRVEAFNDVGSVYIPPEGVLATPDSPNFLGMYSMAPMTDYEEQIRGINYIRNTVINATRRIICYNQPIYDDMRLEMTEYAGLTLAVRDPSVFTVVRPMYDQVAITILDNDVAVVGLERTFYQVSEDVGVVEVCAIVYSPVVVCPIEFLFEVNLIVINGMAVSPMDYGNVSSILAFDTCDTRQCTEISIEDDMKAELTESFFITLERTPGLDSRITLDPVDGEIEISDNDGLCYSQPNCVAGSEIPIDTPTPKDCCAGSNDGQSYSDSGGNCVVPQCVVHGFANASYDVEEGGVLDTTFELNVKRTTSLPLVLMGNITSESETGTAKSTDFENLQPISFETSADIRLFTTDDNITLEYDDTVILRFTPDNSSFIPGVEGAGEFIRDTAVVNIIDNDRLEIALEEPNYSIQENAANNPVIRLQFRKTQSPFTMTIFPVNISDLNQHFNFKAENFINISQNPNTIAIAGDDFTSESFTITISATEDRPAGPIYEDIQQDDPVPRFRVIDDDVNEIKQSFALVAVLGDDVPDRFACFQKQFGDTDCFGRTGATSITIVDNDGFSQQCYSQPNCEAGSEIKTPADTPTAKDCCVGTNEGQSYADSGGNCIVEQCVVHGFANASYAVEEGEILDTTFELNVKGTTSLALVILGTITSERGTASSMDFENLQPIHFETSADIHLFTTNDAITLEYNDTVILRFTPDNPLLIPGVESRGEYIRHSATVNITDNDRLEIKFEDTDHSITEGSPLSVLMHFRSTQSPFTLTLRPVSIASAEATDMSSFINCATIGEDSRATPGDDFTNMTLSYMVEGASTELGVFEIELKNITHDNNIDEIEKSFAVVAEIGGDVPDSFACFQRQVGDTECLGRTGATEIKIMDNDVMIIGFNQRGQNVSENAGYLSIDVSTNRTSERNHTIEFRYQESSNTAIVETFTTQNNPLYDALFGNGTDTDTAPDESIVVTHILHPGNRTIPSLMTMIQNDSRPEDRECYTISIITTDIKGVRELFTCNEDESNPTDFFCDHTVCIDDDDEPFRIAFAEKTYNVTEREGRVEVCVNLTHPEMDIHNETVRVESYNNASHIPPDAVLATPDSPDFLGEYSVAPMTDYEEQIRGINHIRNTVINATTRNICYNQTIYDDMRLEMSEYVGLTLTVRDSSVRTEINATYDQVTIQILDDDSAVVGLERPFYQVSEDVGVVNVCAIVYSPAVACPIEFFFEVNLIITNGSAEPLMDYGSVSSILALNFNTCDTQRCTEIPIEDDTIVELTESFFVTLERTPGLDSRITLDPHDGEIEITDNDGSSSELSGGTIAAIVVAITLVVLMIMVVVMMISVFRRQIRKKEHARDRMEERTEYKMEELNVYESTRGDNVDEAQQPTLFHQLKLELSQKNMIFSKKSIHLSKIVGQGESGVVYCGYLDSGGGRDMVAIKTCKALSLGSDKENLLKEVTTMLSFTHSNVMSLIGVCFDEEVPLIIMPYMSNGNVLGYVKQNKEELYFDSQANQEQVEAAMKLCLGLCHQISKGMEYLASQKFVHRDLAARNCMIDRHGVIKVADFGMSEDMYVRNYFRRDKSDGGGEEKVPIRWMAPESIEKDIYNERTDVWAFGVTCWEVFTCGRVPYAGVPAMTLLSQLHNGHRLDRPSNVTCSDEIWDMMMSCWTLHPQQRPEFTRLVKELFDMLDSDSSYLKLS